MRNKTFFLGRLGRETELRYTQNGNAVCHFSLAVKNPNQKETVWLDVRAWRKTAENCNKFLNKGSTVFIEGHVVVDKYVDRNEKTIKKFYIDVDSIVFLDKKRREEVTVDDFVSDEQRKSLDLEKVPGSQVRFGEKY